MERQTHALYKNSPLCLWTEDGEGVGDSRLELDNPNEFQVRTGLNTIY
jgi:hypothetical protein